MNGPVTSAPCRSAAILAPWQQCYRPGCGRAELAVDSPPRVSSSSHIPYSTQYQVDWRGEDNRGPTTPACRRPAHTSGSGPPEHPSGLP
jgi:hypothetical protein